MYILRMCTLGSTTLLDLSSLRREDEPSEAYVDHACSRRRFGYCSESVWSEKFSGSFKRCV
jgi:hypothetical protein